MITAKVSLTQALKLQRQFVAETGSGHHMILDDAAGASGAKPIEPVPVVSRGVLRSMSSPCFGRSTARS